MVANGKKKKAKVDYAAIIRELKCTIVVILSNNFVMTVVYSNYLDTTEVFLGIASHFLFFTSLKLPLIKAVQRVYGNIDCYLYITK